MLDNELDGSFLTTATSDFIMSQLNKYNLFSSRPHLTKDKYSVLASYPGRNMVGGDTKHQTTAQILLAFGSYPSTAGGTIESLRRPVSKKQRI